MSLDVMLYDYDPHSPEPDPGPPAPRTRKAAQTITPAGAQEQELYWANITHNLGPMAQAAGLYLVLWQPLESGYKQARDITPALEEGLKRLEADPEGFEGFNAQNGWGTYAQFVPWVRDYLAACKKYPEAYISVSR